MSAILRLEGVHTNIAQYKVLHGVSLEVPEGGVHVILGRNGAGKTTTLKAASNLLALENGEVGEGRISFKGQSIMTIQPDRLVQQGLFHVREGRRIFSEMTVEDNLIAASYALDRRQAKPDYDKVYAFFPRLKERRRQIAGYLSGGEQQMLAIGRALARDIKLLLLDEPYEGLAPVIVQEIEKTLQNVKKLGITTIIVEQNAIAALKLADRAIIMDSGQIVFDGTAQAVLDDTELRDQYLAI